MNIKSWFTTSATSPHKTLNVEILDATLSYYSIKDIREEIASKIAGEYLERNGETITKDILHNRDFADSVYNAIVLSN